MTTPGIFLMFRGMAWRMHGQVVKGEIDNREPGRVRGRLWLAGRAEPVVLDLEGDALRDMAGCMLTFSNPLPAAGDPAALAPLQCGAVGDMTASRKVRVPDVSEEELIKRYRAGQPFPSHWANSLYLEWFSEANGRVVIESADYRVTLSEPAWRMTREQALQQSARNREALEGFLERLTSPPTRSDGYDPEADRPMDEFQWEKFLKESDTRNDRYGELLQKYEGHPQQEQLVARAMGWDWLDENLDAKERGALQEAGPDIDGDDDAPPLEPDPATEGVDWVRDKHGHPEHPLVIRTSDVAIAMHHLCKKRGLLGETGDQDLRDMIFQAQCTGAKLAGALGSLCYRGEDADPGFIVACLKRALKYLHQALTATSRVEKKKLLPESVVQPYRADLLSIREAILTLMQRFRRQLGA